jgi:hypothetical protein
MHILKEKMLKISNTTFKTSIPNAAKLYMLNPVERLKDANMKK